jgi:benzoate/toluate 1,2-dioxygenase beta subunit
MGLDPDRVSAAISLVNLEGALLDEKDWDAWLDLYTEDAEYWIPAWDDEHTLTQDPNSEISLIYYGNREGLESRVFRLRTERSLASTPLPRTCHMISSHRVEAIENGALWVRSSWTTHSYRLRESQTYYGHQEHLLVRVGDQLRIARRKIILANDRIANVLDIYSV